MSTTGSFDDLPYAEQYMREILRPRVERAIQLVDGSMTESIWQQVTRLLAAEQPSGGEETPAMIRKLLEGQLGLRIEARLEVSFTALGESAPTRREPAPQVVVRPAMLPLVNAVLASGRRTAEK